MAAGDIVFYDAFLVNVQEKVFNLETDTIKLGLVTSTYTPTATDAEPCWGEEPCVNLPGLRVLLDRCEQRRYPAAASREAEAQRDELGSGRVDAARPPESDRPQHRRLAGVEAELRERGDLERRGELRQIVGVDERVAVAVASAMSRSYTSSVVTASASCSAVSVVGQYCATSVMSPGTSQSSTNSPPQNSAIDASTASANDVITSSDRSEPSST